MTTKKFSDMSLGQKAVYGLILLVILAVLSPLAAMAAATVTNIFTALIFGAGIFIMAILAKPAHWLLKVSILKFMKATARMNPIETLELDLNKKREALQRFLEFVKQMAAGYNVAKDDYEALVRDFPDRDLSSRKAMVAKMGEAVELLRGKGREAGHRLDEYEREVDFMKRDHAFAKRVGGAMKQLRNVSGVDALDELLKSEAIGQVRDNVAMAFAELDMLLDQEGTIEILRIANDRSPETENEDLLIPHFADKS